MVSSYLFPISYAFMTFPIAALLFTIPFLIVQYRRHGYINKIRALVLYLLLLYLMNAFYLVLLPMPASRHNLPPSGSIFQYIPFQFVQDMLQGTTFSPDKLSSYWSLLLKPAFLQVVFNIALTVPFGMFLRYYFRTRWVVCILLSFALSLSFEITQVTGIYGFYDHPYRLFDIDDLITNTLGGLFGYRIAIWISSLLPRIEQLDENVDLSTKRVTYTRRGIASFIDCIVWLTGFGLLSTLDLRGVFWITTGIYFMLIPYLTNGRTLGKWIVRIRVKGSGNKISLWTLIVRYGLLYWILFGSHALLLNSSVMGVLSSAWVSVFHLLILLMDVTFFIHLITRLFNKNKVLLYEKLSKSSHAISWPDKPSSPDHMEIHLH